MKALRTGESYTNQEVMLDFGEAQRIISMNIVAIRDRDDAQGEKISFFLVTGRDITERAQQDRRKDDFLGVASHELRGPLTPLTGLLQLARKRVETGHELDLDLLVRAESQVTRLRRLIESLLDLSRIQTGKLPLRPEPTEMCDLVEQIMQPWLRSEHGHRISLELVADPCWVNADPDRIEQVVTNLVDNAIKHGPKGPIRVRVAKENEMIQLSVCDNGGGPPPDVIDRIFSNALYVPRESRSTFGLGLGLFITRQIVESHGGSLSIGAAGDCSSNVTASFPAIDAP